MRHPSGEADATRADAVKRVSSPGPAQARNSWESSLVVWIRPEHLQSAARCDRRVTLSFDIRALTERVREESSFVDDLLKETGRVIVGQQQMLERVLIGLLSNGHVLLEGVPGLAKTLTVHTLADGISARFQRIQFTPDLLPADLVGHDDLQPAGRAASPSGRDRSSPTSSSPTKSTAPRPRCSRALLEAMQERQVTIGDKTYPLPEPFLVLATQNPIEQEGTYPLPEAQVDRFMLKVKVGYPSRDEERVIMDRMGGEDVAPRHPGGVHRADCPRRGPSSTRSTSTTRSRTTS